MSFAKNYHRWIIDEFAPYLGKVVAEVGAGRGDVTRLLKRADIRSLLAFEPSASLFPSLQRELSDWPAATAVNDFFSCDSSRTFDTVLYLNVLEHIEDDVAEISKARKMLKPDGYLLIFVPALRWLYSDFDKSIGHFRRYGRGGLRRLVCESGFRIVKLRYFDLAGVLPWYVNFVLLRRPMTTAGVSAYDRWVVPVMRRLERWFSPPIGKNILLVAQPRNRAE